MARKSRVHEVQVPGQVTRLIACDDIQGSDEESVLTADGITVYRVASGVTAGGNSHPVEHESQV